MNNPLRCKYSSNHTSKFNPLAGVAASVPLLVVDELDDPFLFDFVGFHVELSEVILPPGVLDEHVLQTDCDDLVLGAVLESTGVESAEDDAVEALLTLLHRQRIDLIRLLPLLEAPLYLDLALPLYQRVVNILLLLHNLHLTLCLLLILGRFLRSRVVFQVVYKLILLFFFVHQSL